MKYPKTLLNLIDFFKTIPGIGNKSSERISCYISTNFSKQKIDEFIFLVNNIKNLKRCPICGLLIDNECSICNNEFVDDSKIVVVESIQDAYSILNLDLNYLFHVLNGSVKPHKGIMLEDLNTDSLINRIRENKNIKEVILACNCTIEGETTSLYLKELLKDEGVIISRIAYGLSVGQDLNYTDKLTLLKSINGRVIYE